MGGRGQTALYILLGLILFIGLLFTLYFVNQKDTEILGPKDDPMQNNPQLAAEKARMQARVDKCLGQVAADSLTEMEAAQKPVVSIKSAEQQLADDIALFFPECFFEYNTIEKLTAANEQPKVRTSLSNDQLTVLVSYPVKGTYEGEPYTLNDFTAKVPTTVRPQMQRALNIPKAMQEKTFEPGRDFLNPDDCTVDLYAYEDQGIYADLIIKKDGTMVAYFYDYTGYLDGMTTEKPTPIIVDLPACEVAS